MARCRKCGIDVFRGRNICPGCLAEFTAMRKTAMKHIEKKYGKFSPQNLTISQKEMRRLTNIWRRDPLKFEMEIDQERGIAMTRGICPNCGSRNDWRVKSSNAFGIVYECQKCLHKADDKDIKKYKV